VKLIRFVAGVVAAADVGFGLLLILHPDTLAEGATAFPHAAWLGAAALGSAGTLVCVAADFMRFFPILCVNVGARTLTVLVGLLYALRQPVLVGAVAAVEGTFAAIFIALILGHVRRLQEESLAHKGTAKPDGETGPARHEAPAEPPAAPSA
jgi:hypothetical protein